MRGLYAASLCRLPSQYTYPFKKRKWNWVPCFSNRFSLFLLFADLFSKRNDAMPEKNECLDLGSAIFSLYRFYLHYAGVDGSCYFKWSNQERNTCLGFINSIRILCLFEVSVH